MLHHDNAPPNLSFFIHKFLVKHKITLNLQLPYSSDVVSADFFVPRVEIYHQKSPTSNDRKDRRTFTMGPTHYSRKLVAGCVPDMEKKNTLEIVYKWKKKHWK